MRGPEGSGPGDPPGATPQGDAPGASLVGTALRGGIGGLLMGLANLVPGISGGTMLLAAGVYPGFIAGIAELTTLRFRARSVVLLGAIVASAALGILLLAGPVRDLVVHQRWLMYSLFIGLTLGGVPLLWKLARPASPALGLAAAGAFALMIAMAWSGGSGGGGSGGFGLAFLAGVAAASAMILPGVSGGYLLLLLGQYEPILGAVDQLKRGLLGSSLGDGPDLALLGEALRVVVPLGVGIVVGVVGVSNLLKWLLEHYEKATLGALLGLLLGAVVGLWPFREAVPPEPGDVVRGQVMTAAEAAQVDPEHWPLRPFAPSGAQVGVSLLAIGAGLGATWGIGRLGSPAPEDPATPEQP